MKILYRHARGFSRASMFFKWIPACAGMTPLVLPMSFKKSRAFQKKLTSNDG
jgi:hypothetical protein